MNKRNTCFFIIFLIFTACVVFGQVACNEFVNFDDNIYITENDHIKSGINMGSIKWAFTAFVSWNWHPLTCLSHILCWSLFGENPSGHHLLNLLLHIGAVIFLFLFLYKSTNNFWASAFTAAFFSLHPLRAESVAWASERKDVLSIFFGMACIYVYAFYAKSNRLIQYFLCLILFSLSLLAKSMLVTMPFILLLLDYWPLGRWQKDINEPMKIDFRMIVQLVWEKVPFIILTIFSCIMTVWAQYKADTFHPPFSARVLNAIISYVVYLRQTLWPFDLVVSYPFEYSFLLWQFLFSFLILVGITIIFIFYFKQKPFLFVGWFWYLGTLIPVSGLVPVNQPMADHYTYLPSIGTAIVLIWGVLSLIKSEIICKKILFPSGIVVIICMSFLTWKQCSYWKNDIVLWTHCLKATKNNYLAYNNRGVAYGRLGQYRQAISDLNRAIDLNSNYFKAYSNRGFAHVKLGQYDLAVKDYNEAIRLKSNYIKAYCSRAIVYLFQGNNVLGCKDAQKACELGYCSILEDSKRKGVCY